MDAESAFEHCHGRQQMNKVGELRDRIVQVLDMLAHLSVVNGENHVMPIPQELLGTQAIHPVDAFLSMASEHPRKRLASELEIHPDRTVKALKREPLDDAPLSGHEGEPLLSAPTVQSFFPPFSPTTPSQPPSRASTPPAPFLFKPLPQTSFSSLTTGGTPLPPVSAQASPFPSLPHASWSDPIVPTSRHQHSLSVGSASGSHMHAQSAASTSVLRSAAIQAPNGSQPPINGSSGSVMGQPIGRMSRSGSISGTPFKNSYSKLGYPDNHHAHPDPSVWHKSKKARNGQLPFLFNSESISLNRSPPVKTAPHTTSAPTTAHNSPSDNEDDDDDSDDDDDEGGSGGVTSSTQAPGSASAATDMPPEFRADVDRIFFEFLNKLCSNCTLILSSLFPGQLN